MKKLRIGKLGLMIISGTLLSFNAAADFSRSFEGYTLFKTNCVICHGPGGGGNGILADRLDYTPADLTNPGLATKTDHQIFQIIEGTAPHSKAGSGMPQWGLAIPQNHIESLVKYVRYLNKSKHKSAGNPIQGKKVYEENCSICHGTDGKGKGILAQVYDMSPADHTNSANLNRMDNATLKAYIKSGGDDTLMPGWDGVLNNAQLDDVISYIRLLSANND